MSAGRFAVYCSAYYGQQIQPVLQPVTRLDSPAQAIKRARSEVRLNPGSVAVVTHNGRPVARLDANGPLSAS